MKNTALRICGIIFLGIAVLHLVRFILRTPIAISDFYVPVWFSFFGFVIPLALSAWLLSLSGKK